MVTTISKWSHCVHPWSFMVFYQHSSQKEGLFKNISVHVTTLLKKWLPISVKVSLYSVTQGVTWSASSPSRSDLIFHHISHVDFVLATRDRSSSGKHRYSSASGLYTGCFHSLECSSLTYSHSLLTLLAPSSISLNTIFSNKAYSFSPLKNFGSLDALSPALLSYYMFTLFPVYRLFLIFRIFVCSSIHNSAQLKLDEIINEWSAVSMLLRGWVKRRQMYPQIC